MRRLHPEFTAAKLTALAGRTTAALEPLGMRAYVTDTEWVLYAGNAVYRRTVIKPVFYSPEQIDDAWKSFVGVGVMGITDQLLAVV